MKQNIIYATMLSAMLIASCTKDEALSPVGAIEERELFVNVSSSDDCDTKVTSALNGSSVEFNWESTDLLGGYVAGDDNLVSFSVVDYDGVGASAEFKGTISDDAQAIRFVYPYVSTAVTGGFYPIDVAAQSDNFTSTFESVAAKSYLVSPDASIDISGVESIPSIAMAHLTGSMQFKIKFPAGFTTTTLTALKISGLPTSANVDLSKSSSEADILSDNTTSSTITISTGGVEVMAETEYSLEAAIIPFTLDEGEALSFEAVLDGGIAYKGESNAASAGGVTFAAGKRHTISTVTLMTDAECNLSSIAAAEDETIVMSFNQEMNAPSSVGESGVTITRNGSAATITSIAKDVNKLIVTIDGGAWNGDDILMSYSGAGLTTTSGAAVPTLTDEVVEPYIVNLVTNGDLESADADSPIWSYTTTTWSLTDPQYMSIEEALDGNKYMKAYIPDGVTVSEIYSQSAKITMKYDTEYMYEYRYYVATPKPEAVDPYNYTNTYIENDNTWATFNYNYIGVTTSSSDWQSYAGTFTFTDRPAADTEATEYLGVLKLMKLDSEIEIYFDDFKLYEYKRHE